MSALSEIRHQNINNQDFKEDLEIKTALDDGLVSVFQKFTSVKQIEYLNHLKASPKPISVQDFAKQQKFKAWLDTILVDPKQLPKIRALMQEYIKSHPNIKRNSIHSSELDFRNANTSKKIRFPNSGPEVGVSGISSQKIKKGDCTFVWR